MNPIVKILKTVLFQSSADKLNTLLNARDEDYLEFTITYDLIDIFLLELYEKYVLLRPSLFEINQCDSYEDLIKGYQILGLKTEAQKLVVVLKYSKEDEMNRYGVTNTTRIPFDLDEIQFSAFEI